VTNPTNPTKYVGNLENALTGKESRKWELRLIRIRPDSASLSEALGPSESSGAPGSIFSYRNSGFDVESWVWVS